MNGNIFVDTNIFIYSIDKNEPEKQARALYILRDLWNFGAGRVSTQVLNEYYVTVTQKLTPGLNAIDAWQVITNQLSYYRLLYKAAGFPSLPDIFAPLQLPR